MPSCRWRGRCRQIAIVELPRPPKGAAGAAPFDGDRAARAGAGGHDIGLSREAGLPAVADPGAALVAAAHAPGIAVVAAAGRELAAAGAGRQRPQRPELRLRRLPAGRRPTRARRGSASSRRVAARRRRPSSLIETPYRNAALLEALLAQLQPSTLLVGERAA